MNKKRVLDGLRHLWEGALAPLRWIWFFAKQRNYPWLVGIAFACGLSFWLIDQAQVKTSSAVGTALLITEALVVSLALALVHAHRNKGRMAIGREETVLRAIGGMPTSVAVILVGVAASILILCVALIVFAFKIFRFFDSSSGGSSYQRGGGTRYVPTTAPPSVSSLSNWDLVWAEIRNDQDGETKVRPCVVVAASHRRAEVLYCTSQSKRQGDPRYLELPVDLGTGKDNYLNLVDRRSIVQSDLRGLVGRLPSHVASVIQSRI